MTPEKSAEIQKQADALKERMIRDMNRRMSAAIAAGVYEIELVEKPQMTDKILSIIGSISEKRVEPRKRGLDGWISHKYPIKGGISIQDAMNRDILEYFKTENGFSKLVNLGSKVAG